MSSSPGARETRVRRVPHDVVGVSDPERKSAVVDGWRNLNHAGRSCCVQHAMRCRQNRVVPDEHSRTSLDHIGKVRPELHRRPVPQVRRIGDALFATCPVSLPNLTDGRIGDCRCRGPLRCRARRSRGNGGNRGRSDDRGPSSRDWDVDERRLARSEIVDDPSRWYVRDWSPRRGYRCIAACALLGGHGGRNAFIAAGARHRAECERDCCGSEPSVTRSRDSSAAAASWRIGVHSVRTFRAGNDAPRPRPLRNARTPPRSRAPDAPHANDFEA